MKLKVQREEMVEVRLRLPLRDELGLKMYQLGDSLRGRLVPELWVQRDRVLYNQLRVGIS